jgi:hypothetical protein
MLDANLNFILMEEGVKNSKKVKIKKKSILKLKFLHVVEVEKIPQDLP